MKQIYVAGPLFTDSEREWNLKLTGDLEFLGYKVFLPQRDVDTKLFNDQNWTAKVYQATKTGLDSSDLLVVVCEPTPMDDGTAWECGYAIAKEKPCIGIRTDIRHSAPGEHVNLMIQESIEYLAGSIASLINYLNNYHAA